MKLVKKYLSDNRDWFAGASLALGILILIAYLPAVTKLTHPKSVIFFLVMLGSGALIIAAIKAAKGYVGRKTGIMDMLTPASLGKKYLLAWGVSFPGTLVLFVVAVWAINQILHHTTGVYISNELFFDTANPSGTQVWDEIRKYLFAACLIHSVVFLGTFSVRGNRFWQRSFIGVVIFMVAVVLILGVPGWLGMPKNWSTGFPLFLEMDVWRSIDGAMLQQKLAWAGSLSGVLSLIVSMSLPVVFWVAAWFKFKELEVR